MPLKSVSLRSEPRTDSHRRGHPLWMGNLSVILEKKNDSISTPYFVAFKN